jgi:UDP-glucose 4-epimerase
MKRRPMVLVTGGAGYIGSHVVAALGERGERVLVLDNLSTGHAEAVLNGQLIVGDVADTRLLEALFSRYDIETVMHFAARIVVPESVQLPLEYYDNNTARTRTLLAACLRARVRHFVFSSTAAVYGESGTGVAGEDTPVDPINPYGRSKLMSEWMLADACKVAPMRSVALRYFNVAGCDSRGRIGQDTPDATHLIKVACQHAVGMRECLEIFGTDYPTPDGTCVRDYIHVEDLAAAHLAALEYLRDDGATVTLNCGYGHGYSVREVIAALQKLVDSPLTVRESPRRTGDMPSLIADSQRLRRQLNWQPRRDDLALILASALGWERQRLERNRICVPRADAAPPVTPAHSAVPVDGGAL